MTMMGHLTNFSSYRTLQATREYEGRYLLMAAGDTNTQDKGGQECFLCLLDPQHPCHTARLEGRLITAAERTTHGEKTALFLLDTETEHIELHFPHSYYHSLVKDLKARGNL